MDQGAIDAAASGDRIAGDELARSFQDADATVRGGVLDALAAHAASGSSSAMELLLRLIDQHRLDRVAIRRILIDDDQADDAHQDVLIAVARSVHRFRGGSAFTTWLYSLARNTAIDQLRRRRENVSLDGDLHLTEARRISSMIATRMDLRAAVATLPEHYRSVLVLRDVEQRTYEEIAEHLDLKVNTVKSRLNRARALLAATVAEGPRGG